MSTSSIRTAQSDRPTRAERIRSVQASAPIFIIGSQRSGTSFLYRLIQNYLTIGFGRDNGHFVRMRGQLHLYGDLEKEANLTRLLNDIVSIPEFSKRFKGMVIDIPAFIASLETRTYAEVVRRWYAEWAVLNDTTRWGGKTPDYSIYAGELYDLFPDAKFIHIIRDGRDVALSLYKLNWGPKSPLQAARHWADRAGAAMTFGRQLPADTYMELHYENLVDDPAREFARIVRFLDWEGDQEALIDRFRREITGQVKSGNYAKWKKEMSARHVRTFERHAGTLLQNLGYDLANEDAPGQGPIGAMGTVFDHLENLARKLARGEGFVGLYVRARRLMRDIRLRLGAMIRR